MIGIAGKWLSGNWRTVLVVGLMSLCMGFAMYANRYKAEAVRQQGLTDKAQHLADTRKEIIDDMQRRQKSVAALDAKYTKELADAKATIDQLERDVANGKLRLQLNATCQKDNAASTPGVDNAASPRLTDSAQRDYFTLRKRIDTVRKQIAGLQQYIFEQCLN